MANLTTDYLDKALTKQSKDLKGYVDKKNGGLEKSIAGVEKNLKDFVKTEIEELALMTARGFAAQGKEIQELIKSVAALANTVEKLSKTIDDLAAMTARQFEALEKKNNVSERMDKLEREFTQLKHTLSA